METTGKAAVCDKCGEAIQPADGRLEVADAEGREVRCERCCIEPLVAALVEGSEMRGEYSAGGDGVLTWEVAARHRSAMARLVGGFLGLVQRAIAVLTGDTREESLRALERLVGEGGSHSSSCACAAETAPGRLCAYCHGRSVLRAAEVA